MYIPYLLATVTLTGACMDMSHELYIYIVSHEPYVHSVSTRNRDTHWFMYGYESRTICIYSESRTICTCHICPQLRHSLVYVWFVSPLSVMAALEHETDYIYNTHRDTVGERLTIYMYTHTNTVGVNDLLHIYKHRHRHSRCLYAL